VSGIGNRIRAIAAEFNALADEVDDLLSAPPTEPEPPIEEPPVVEPEPPVVPELPVDEPPSDPEPTGKLKPLAADPIVGDVAKPPIGGSYVDPVYGVTIYRASAGTRHDYSRRQAWNADNSRYLQLATNGYWHLHDGKTYQHVRQLSFLAGDAEAIWHPTDPRKLLHTGREGQGGVWYWLDVETNTREVAFDLRGKTPFSNAQSFWTKAEGTTSADGRYIALMCETYSSASQRVSHYGIVTVDIQTGNVVGSLEVASRPDHVSMSPTGQYAVVSWVGGNGTRAYTRDFSGYTQLHSTSEHSDLALGADGVDYYVYTDYTAGQIRAKRLDNGQVFNLSSLYPRGGSAYAAHISGQAFGKPGWVVISTYADYSNYGSTRPDPQLQPQYRKVWLAELRPNGRQYSVAHIRSTATGYFGEPQATISRDGSRIMYATNLGSGSADSFVAMLPKDWDK
jgi:hypothetical protein